MNTFAYLQSQRVNLQHLQESSCHQLTVLLEKIEGTKVIVLDDELVGPLGLITAPSFFGERSIKLIKLEEDAQLPKNYNNIIFLVRPKVSTMDTINTLVLRNKLKGRFFHIYFVPRRSCLCLMHLEHNGALGNFTNIEELPWHFFPLDADVLSMELPKAFRHVSINGDSSVLYQAALGLVQLQQLYGRIPKIYGKGQMAQQVWEHAKQLGAEQKMLLHGDKGAIDQLILLDRNLDLLSPLATQLTYEGLIDELYGIQHNQLTLPAELFAGDTLKASSTQMDKKIMVLNSGDELYATLRNKHFNEVGTELNRTAKIIAAHINATKQQENVQEMKLMVDKLPTMMALKQSLVNHVPLLEVMKKLVNAPQFHEELSTEQSFMNCEDLDKPNAYIEQLIGKKCNLRDVLRLMCIQCAAASGFKEKVLNYYKRELVQVYGLEVLLSVSNLEKAGLLRTQAETRPYAVLRKTLRLTVDDAQEVNPKDISYVHSIYAPLLARLIEQSLKPLGWQTLKSHISYLPGPTFEDFQAQLIGIGGRQSSTPSEGCLLNIPRIVLVFVVGGITFAEIAALRFLAAQEDNNVELIIATTKIINKKTFLESLL